MQPLYSFKPNLGNNLIGYPVIVTKSILSNINGNTYEIRYRVTHQVSRWVAMTLILAISAERARFCLG